MRKPLPDLAAGDLSLANLYDHVDPLDCASSEYLVFFPPITLAHVREHTPRLIEQFVSDGGRESELTMGSEDFDADAFQELVDDFRNTGGYDDWSNSYQPAMNYCWPVHIFRDAEDLSEPLKEIAALMDDYAPSCTLIMLPEADEHVYAIALSGGGQDLSEEIVSAYLCAGVVPPLTLLQRQRQSMEVGTFRRLEPLYGRAIGRAQEKLALDCGRLAEDYNLMRKASGSPAATQVTTVAVPPVVVEAARAYASVLGPGQWDDLKTALAALPA